MEMRRRSSDETRLANRNSPCQPVCGPLLRECVPEIAGAGLVVIGAGVSLANAWTDVTAYAGGVQFDAAWTDITNQWPVLMTADTLLALQSLFRLPLLLSVLLRAPPKMEVAPQTVPLAGYSILLYFMAGMSRVIILTFDEAYGLDGPLGGRVNYASEIASLLVLTFLAAGALRDLPNIFGLVCSVAIACFVAQRHCFAISENVWMDTLFVFAQVMETFGAGVHLTHTFMTDGGAQGGAASFVHFLLPLQQVLPVYFFLEAFEEVPDLSRSGHPFMVLRLISAIGMGLYCLSATIHLVMRLEEPAMGDEQARHHNAVASQ